MELYLENVRGHEQPVTFKFPRSGLSLLQGESGSGKSSILNSISFALYGKPKVIARDCTKCKVIFGFNNWRITRTKGPNRLVLQEENGDIYEDDAAQEMIDNTYGIDFNISSYITQRKKDNFCYLGPSERIAFLERLALGEANVSEIKKKCRAKIKERKDKLLQKAAELEALTKEYGSIKKPEEVPYPLKGRFSQEKVDKQDKLRKNNDKKILKLKAEIKGLIAKREEQRLMQQKLKQLQNEIEATKEQIHEIDQELSDIPYKPTAEIEARLEYLKMNKELIALKTSFQSDQQQYMAMCTIEISQLQDELDSLLKIGYVEDKTAELRQRVILCKKAADLRETLKNCTEEISQMNTVEEYEEEIAELQTKEQSLVQQKMRLRDRLVVHKCPKCSTFLRVVDSTLSLAEGYTDTDIVPEKQIDADLKRIKKERGEYEYSLRELQRLQEDQRVCERDLAKLPEFEKTVSDYESEYENHKNSILEQESRMKRIEQLKQKIANKDLSLSVQSIKRRVDQKAEQIKRLEFLIKPVDCDLKDKDNIEALQNLLTTSKLYQQKHDIKNQQKKQVEKKLRNLCSQMEQIHIDDEDFSELVTNAESEMAQLEEKASLYKETAENLLVYMRYREELAYYDRCKQKLEDARVSEGNARVSLAVADKMMRKIQETESAAVLNTITTINNHISYYLEKFFQQPIVVEICSFKDMASGDKKPSVNIRVAYKGGETDINELSGGEAARVELAICLSINSLTGGGLIMIDEALSSLDEGTVSVIAEVLRQEAVDQEKLIVTVLHQANEGEFDYVLTLGAE